MIRIQKRLREIMRIESQGKRHNNLVDLAKEIGVSILQYKGGANGYGPADETELIIRIRDACKTNYIMIASISAIVSAITALLSAIAAWWLVIFK